MDFSGISSNSTLGRTLRAPLALLPKGLHVPILQGPLRGKTWTIGAHTHGCWLGSYEFDKQKMFKRLVRRSSVVYDVGANAGFYTLLASVLVGPQGHVVAFEPQPRNLEYLRSHVSLNNLSNVSVLDLAVADAPGTASFSGGAGSATGSISPSGELVVRTSSLDALVGSKAVPPPDLIKMDIEGGEGAALRGAHQVLSEFHPVVLLATHGRLVHDECVSLLRTLGYEVKALDGGSVEETDELIAQKHVHR